MEANKAKKEVTLYYWGIRGRGSINAQYLAYLGIPFNYVQYTKPEDWIAQKTQFTEGGYPFPTLPMIEDSNTGKIIGNTPAILQYLSQKYDKDSGFRDLDQIYDFEETLHTVLDLVMYLTKSVFTKDQEVLKTKLASAVTGLASAQRLGALVKRIEKDGWSHGGRFTYIDIILADFAEVMNAMTNELKVEVTTKENLESLTKLMNKVHNLPGIKEFRASEKFRARPFCPPSMAGFF